MDATLISSSVYQASSQGFSRPVCLIVPFADHSLICGLELALVVTSGDSGASPVLSFACDLKLPCQGLVGCRCVVPLPVAENPASFFAKGVTASWAVVRNTVLFVRAIVKNLRSAFWTADSQNIQLGCVKHLMLLSHDGDLQ